jgi:hypothetical protein
MKGIEVACLFLILIECVAYGRHDVYIVAIEGDPVVSYEGNIEGLPATATDTVEEMNFHR